MIEHQTADEEIAASYPWLDDYLTNIDKVDVQHKALFQTANKLYRQLMGHGSLEDIDKLFLDLIRQTRVHFQTEEKIMQRQHYPHFQEHKQLHDLLIQQIEDMQDSQQLLKSLNFEQPWIEKLEIVDYLRGWLVNHIVVEDRKLGLFLHDSGFK